MTCSGCGSHPGFHLIPASLIPFGLVAVGAITNGHLHLDRYERIEEKLAQLGARIQRVH